MRAPRMVCRSAFVLALVFGALNVAAQVRAQSAKYPDRSIRMMAGFSAGGGTDVSARIVAQKMLEGAGPSVLVENRPRASGLIVAEAVAKSGAHLNREVRRLVTQADTKQRFADLGMAGQDSTAEEFDT